MAGARPSAPASESELLARAQGLAGRTLGRIAAEAGLEAPADQKRMKGWVGEIIEWCLGADAAALPEPDFRAIGVELKTLPVNSLGRPAESTYVCVVPLTGELGEWKRSNVYRKLARVLWVPVEADRGLPLRHRRIGNAFLWSPDVDEEQALRTDWEELTEMIARDGLDRVSARHGRCLQIRPKAAHARVLTRHASPDGASIQTNPRGFYLRAKFTGEILAALHAGGVRP
ncbi:MAG: DNA mismatch repair endonuclease MutH [Gammaproteobacteria bacterium]|nr:DNA mismatch repair endonuclease MutH [Gammaproteobacteria bacterium]